jgi:Uma2 family endonuclease
MVVMSTNELRKLTVVEYERMIEAGVLASDDPIELLDGLLVRKDRAKAGDDPMTVGTEHSWAVQNLLTVLAAVSGHGCHVRLQQPVVLPPDGEPEPDGAIALGTNDDYRSRKPVAADVPCVIEVADSSLERDRVTKLRIDAEGGIVQYVIINLVDSLVEVYERPIAGKGRYADARRLGGRDAVEFSCGQGRCVSVDVARLLPAR